MAGKSKSETVGMVCSVCKSQNYATKRNKINMEKKLVLKKFCKNCKKMTSHKERTKLK